MCAFILRITEVPQFEVLLTFAHTAHSLHGGVPSSLKWGVCKVLCSSNVEVFIMCKVLVSFISGAMFEKWCFFYIRQARMLNHCHYLVALLQKVEP